MLLDVSLQLSFRRSRISTVCTASDSGNDCIFTDASSGRITLKIYSFEMPKALLLRMETILKILASDFLRFTLSNFSPLLRGFPFFLFPGVKSLAFKERDFARCIFIVQP